MKATGLRSPCPIRDWKFVVIGNCNDAKFCFRSKAEAARKAQQLTRSRCGYRAYRRLPSGSCTSTRF